MAKAEVEQAAPPKGGKFKTLLVLIIVSAVAAGGGFMVPRLFPGLLSQTRHTESHESTPADGQKLAFVPFDQVVANVNDERLTRFLRVKLIIVVDEAEEKQVSELILKNKAILKNWLISYLSDKAMPEVTGGASINRARREIQDQFNTLLCPDGSEKIRDVLFEEFNVQ
jgi:flagellar basal body-associated protein FliL